MHEILVPFKGEGSGAAELTWAQRNVWRMMADFGDRAMTGGTMPLAEGTTVENIKHLLSFIVSRHHALRTRVRVEPDGTPLQVLSTHGEVALEIVDVEPGEDPAEVAAAVRTRYAEAPFDIEKEWPVKMAVIRQDHVPVYFTAMYPHMVIDGYGFEALVRDLDNLDQETGEHLGPRAGVQPIEIAAQQQTAASRRQSDAAIRHWERLMMSIPAHRFPEVYEPQDERWWELTFDSPASHLAVTAIAARTGLNTGPILLGAYAVALGRVTGIPLTAVRTLVSNRFRPDFAESVTVLVQPSLCVIDVAEGTFDEVAARAWRSQLAAGKHGYYDPRDLWTMFARVNAARGEEVTLGAYFNDGRRALAAPRPGPLPTPAEVRAALPLTTLTWGPRTNNPDIELIIDVQPVPDTVSFELVADTRVVSPEQIERIPRTMEEVLIAAAFDPSCRSGVGAAAVQPV